MDIKPKFSLDNILLKNTKLHSILKFFIYKALLEWSYLYRVLNDTDAIGAQHFDPVLATTQKESNMYEPFNLQTTNKFLL